MIVLSKEQEEALSEINKFIKSKDKVSFTLSGYAGTGKTFLTKYLLDKLQQEGMYSFMLCAPTHKAALVLQEYSGRDVITIHKLLSLSPILDIMDLDMANLEFYLDDTKLRNYMVSDGLIICDEASMVNDDLYDMLVKQSKKYGNKILFLGDIAQIQPVNNHKVSKVFDDKNLFVLTKIFRQNEDHPISEILSDSRSKFISNYKEHLSQNGSIYVYDNPTQFISAAAPLFQEGIADKNILHAKIISYTNKRVGIFNNSIRKLLFNVRPAPFCVGDILMAYDNDKNERYVNAMDYIVEEVQECSINIPGYGEVYGAYRLLLYDQYFNNRFYNYILHDKSHYPFIAEAIEFTRQDALRAKGRQKGLKWQKYFSMIGSFSTTSELRMGDNRVVKNKSFDYGYGLTIHRSQGSSINNVFYDLRSISYCRNPNEKIQLNYVALSRVKQNIHILQ